MASHVASSKPIKALISSDSCLMFTDSTTANNKILDHWATKLRTRSVGGFIFDVSFDVHAGRSLSKGWYLPDLSGYDCVLVVSAGNNFMKKSHTVLSEIGWQNHKREATMVELAQIGEAIKQRCGGFVFIGNADDWPFMMGANADDRHRYDSMLFESIRFCEEDICIGTAFLGVNEANGGCSFDGLPIDCFTFRDSQHLSLESAEPLFRYLHSLLVHSLLAQCRS